MFLFITFIFTGCNTTPAPKPEKEPTPSPLTLVNPNLFKLISVPSEEEIFALPKAEKSKFLAEYNEYISQGLRADKAIERYLDSTMGYFSYDAETFTASESQSKQQGNCVSLAILTQAYANVAGVETGFREVSTYPIFKKEQDLLIVSTHFNTKLYAPKESEEKDKDWIQILRAGTVVDYFPQQNTFYLGNATYSNLVSKFYSNLATDALIDEHFNLSYSLINEALKFTPKNPELINLLAILHRRAGDTKTAEQLFQFAIQHNLTSSNLIASYRFLAAQQSNTDLVERLNEELEKAAKTPFDFLLIAKQSLEKKHFGKAKKILNKIIEQHPYLPEPYFELAKAHYLQNDHDLAKEALEKAIKMSDSQEKTGMYEAKLKSLELML